MVFGRDTAASFLRDSNEVTVLLGQGNVSVFHDGGGIPVRMKIGDVSVIPVSGFKTLGEVAMLNGAVVVTAKEGMLRVEGNGQVVNVAKGKTITVVPRANAAPDSAKTPGGAGRCCGSNIWGIVDAGIGAGALIVGAVAASRASTASNNASAAQSAATAADSTAAAAAAAAASAASAAAAAASAAAAALSEANAAAIAAGCALNAAANEGGHASPYTPPAGVSCSNPATW
jgi:hypothetical protein